ncbi:MAG: cold shock domain-containing protein [Pseudomonadota bacterium]
MIIKFIGDAVMAAFDDAGDALQAAIAIQEQIKDDMRGDRGGLPCKIGVATGVVYGYRTSDGRNDYLGSTVDTAARLCEQARGNAILLSVKTYQAANTTKVASEAGKTLNRDSEEYFGEKNFFKGIKGFKEPVGYYNLFWQAQRDYAATEPAGETTANPRPEPPKEPPKPELPLMGQRLRGVVVRMRENYGFVSYTNQEGQREERFFHRGACLTNDIIQENDVVFFLPWTNPEGRKQGKSVIKLGGQLRGRLVRLTDRGFGFINVVTDTPSQPLDVFVHINDMEEGIQEGDDVFFTLSEGRKGLAAVKVRPLSPAGEAGAGLEESAPPDNTAP